MTRWMKAGFLFSGIYLALILLFIIAVIFGIGGSGEDNIFGWLLIFSGYPLVWLLNNIGINAVISTDRTIILLIILQEIVIFLIGAGLSQLFQAVKRIIYGNSTRHC